MFCTSCGQKFAEPDRFCGGCGRPRPDEQAGTRGLPISELTSTENRSLPTEPDWSWENSFNYKRIIEVELVQDIFDSAQRRGKQGLELNDYLDLLTPVLPAPGKALFGFTSKLGVSIVENTNLAHHHEISRSFSEPPGWVIASLACALAGRKCDVLDIRQTARGLTILALIPMTLFRGEFVLESKVSSEGNQTVTTFILKALAWALPGGLVKRRSRNVAEEIFGDVVQYLREIDGLR